MTAEYIDSYYSRTLVSDESYPSLNEDIEADVCVIGGGLAGLATALGLVERGKRVVLMEANRIGWGASGRNGGFCLTGFPASTRSLINKLGKNDAREVYGLTLDAQKLIRKRIKEFKIKCDSVDGHVAASWYDDPDAIKRKAEFLNEMGERVEFWPREKTRDLYATDKYYEALFFPEHFHMHPLRYARAIARQIVKKGGQIFENSSVIKTSRNTEPLVAYTDTGSVKAEHIVFCGSAYFENAPEPRLRDACLPIATYVMVTEPIEPALFESVIKAPYAMRDTRYADDYYRPLPDNRLLWGGRISVGKDPDNLAEEMRRDMVKVYPQFENVKPEVAWSGLMGYTVHRMPLIGRFEPGVWYCTNFGGNGVGPTTAGGEIIAKAIAEHDQTYKLFKPFGFDYAGGVLGPLVAQAVYRSWEISDFIGEWKNRIKKAG